MKELQEALAAVEDRINTVNPTERIPNGATLVAARLDRGDGKKGNFIVTVGDGWQPTGCAVALKNIDGKISVIASNVIFGHWTQKGPRVLPTHLVRCKKCGNSIVMPLAVWQAKDTARDIGVSADNIRNLSGWDILRTYGHCSCGGTWDDARDVEKKLLSDFAADVIQDISKNDKPFGPFLPPSAFKVSPIEYTVDIGQFNWMNAALAKSGACAVPFAQELSGTTIMFNPGYWIGLTDNKDDTGLFFSNAPMSRYGANDTEGFDPAQYDGL